jgi:hypothetical protein
MPGIGGLPEVGQIILMVGMIVTPIIATELGGR